MKGANNGKVVAQLPSGPGVDATSFDPAPSLPSLGRQQAVRDSSPESATVDAIGRPAVGQHNVFGMARNESNQSSFDEETGRTKWLIWSIGI